MRICHPTGAFHQPILVWADLQLLDTLPAREFVSGLAEVVKMAACLDSDLFEYIENESTAGTILQRCVCVCARASVDVCMCGCWYFMSDNCSPLPIMSRHAAVLRRLVQRSVEIKADVVAQDEREKAGGLRAILNWGHTVGHGIETLVEPYLLHGECVAIGCAVRGTSCQSQWCSNLTGMKPAHKCPFWPTG